MSKRIDQLISKAGTAINNSLQNSELQAYLNEFGYSIEKLTAGKAICDNAAAVNIKQYKEYGDQYQATHDLEGKRELAHKAYVRFVKVARIALPDEQGAWQALALSGRRKESASGWLVQCNQFYTNLKANSSWLEKMNAYGMTSEKLTAGEGLLNDAEEALNKQKTEMGEAQEATRLRDEAADELQAWYSDFIAIARIALEDKPQYMEMLGVVER